MRVLWATHQLPDPLRGGGWTHAYEMLRHAATRHRVTLLTGGISEPDGVSPAAMNAVESLDIEVVPVRWQRRRPRHRLELLWRAATGLGTVGFWEVAPCATALTAAVADRETQERFDLVHVWAGEMAPVAAATRAPSALFVTDAYTVSQQRELRHAATARHRMLARLEGWSSRRWESTQYRRASALACVSPDDAATLEQLTDRKIAVVPPGIADDWFVASDRGRDPYLVTFVAALDYRPNVDGVQWLLDEVWPPIAARRPEARLRVVGRNASPELRAQVRAAGPRVELHCDVPDVRPFLWETAVVLLPLRLGAGLKNKTLHAAATGAPIVATPVAVEGIAELTSPEHVVVAATADGLVEAVLHTLADPGAATARAERARVAVEAYRSQVVAEAFDAWWAQAASMPRRETADAPRAYGRLTTTTRHSGQLWRRRRLDRAPDSEH